MEARLGALNQDGGRETRDGKSVAAVEDASEAVAATSGSAAGEGAPNAWPDESAESAMLSELRERGEKPVAVVVTEPIGENETKPLPSLDELVKRLPPDVREALDDLFRVKFVRVTRLPQKALTK